MHARQLQLCLCNLRAVLRHCYIVGAYIVVLHSDLQQMGFYLLTPFPALDRVATTCEADLPAERTREGSGFPSYQPPLAQRPEAAPGLSRKLVYESAQARVAMEGVQGQLPAGARWTYEVLLAPLRGRALLHSADRRLCGAAFRGSAASARIEPEASNAWAQGVDRC
jgi:hypothetical protein